MNLKKFLLHAFGTLVIMLSLFQVAQATPIPLELSTTSYGYNAESNICNYKSINGTESSNLNLIGDYYDLRECRRAHPQIIFKTGLGILLWSASLLAIILFNFWVFASIEKWNSTQKNTFAMRDTFCFGIIIFFLILLQHYFDVQRAVYNYPSDFDHILYNTLIHPSVPGALLTLYLTSGTLRAMLKWREAKKRKKKN